MSLLKLEDISYKYDGSNNYVLKDINFEFEKGKIYAIVGKSGAGKTTLLSLLSALTSPSDGSILYNDNNIEKIDKYEYRSKYVGVIFQSFNLLPMYTAKENVILSMDIAGVNDSNKEETALDILEKVELTKEKADRKILKLSGGEQQRVAIARALSYNPDVLLADEPTGNLDRDTELEVMNILKKLAYEEDKCVIIVTHSSDVSRDADVVYKLEPIKN
ncbi:ABC transporter ATP-binding protein [uncultured Anaerofustis sp.]|uniref:ABC transporter ATP-binding protein n=1 Tax=uncultured Anaerofustis sp. TaxID=904996 RepID=UPI00260122CB|nr:ABC transporter ATP-binding protein [uncultured Anaerofustis sp.]